MLRQPLAPDLDFDLRTITVDTTGRPWPDFQDDLRGWLLATVPVDCVESFTFQEYSAGLKVDGPVGIASWQTGPFDIRAVFELGRGNLSLRVAVRATRPCNDGYDAAPVGEALYPAPSTVIIAERLDGSSASLLGWRLGTPGPRRVYLDDL